MKLSMQAISPTLPPADGKQPKDKVIYSSTGAAYIESLYSKGLTDYAAEYASKGIFEELNFIAPPVPIASRKFEYKKMGVGDFWADEADDERARNGDFTRVPQKGEIVLASAINRGLEIVIDKSEITVGTKEKAVRRLMKMLAANELFRAYSLAQKMSVSTLSKKWSDASSKPDSDLRNLAEAVGNNCGVRANKIVVSSFAWGIRMDRYEDLPSSVLSPQQVADKINVGKVLISKENVPIKKNGKISNAPILAEGTILAFYNEDDPSDEDFSAIKRFCTDFRVYEEDCPKYVKITVEHYSFIAQIGAASVCALNIS